MLSVVGVSNSLRAIAVNRLFALVLPIISCYSFIPPAWAVTVRTCGPFDVSFYGLGEDYVNNGTTYTGTKNWTTAEMDDVAAMVQIWDQGISNAAGPRQIKLYMMWDDLGTNVLGSSYNDFQYNSLTAWTDTEYLWRRGTNFTNSHADAFIQFGTGVSWYTGSSTPSGSEVDFQSVVCHEIGHSLGVISTYNSGTDRWSYLGLTAWDKLLRDAQTDGNQPKANSKGTPSDFIETANPVYFDGAYAKAANGGNRVAIYAPDPYQGGSSLTHLNESTFPNALMSPQIAYGQMIRQPTALEWQIMKDLGWTLDTVNKTWTKAANTLNWGTDNNWNIAGVPDGAQTARFTNFGLAANDTIILGGDRSVGGIVFDTTTTFTIGGGSGVLTIGSSGLTRSSTSSGIQTIARPVVLGANAVSIAGTGALNLAGGGTSNGTFTVASGAALGLTGGTFTLNGGTFTNSGTINFSGGTANFNSVTTIPGVVNVNGGTVKVQSGTLTFQGAVTQLVGATLTGGTWKVMANSTLNITSGGNITTNQGDVSLEGLGSTFENINSLTDNQGYFSVLGGRDFTTFSDLSNSGTLTVGAGCNFSVTGDLSGSGHAIVDGMMTADTIFQDTLTIGPGAKVSLRPLAKGPLGLGTIQTVPEPATLIMLLIAAAVAGSMRISTRWVRR